MRRLIVCAVLALMSAFLVGCGDEGKSKPKSGDKGAGQKQVDPDNRGGAKQGIDEGNRGAAKDKTP